MWDSPKPAGMLMHPSHRENSGTILNAVVHYLNYSKSEPPAPTGGLIRPVDTAEEEKGVLHSDSEFPHKVQPPAIAGGTDTCGSLFVAEGPDQAGAFGGRS